MGKKSGSGDVNNGFDPPIEQIFLVVEAPDVSQIEISLSFIPLRNLTTFRIYLLCTFAVSNLQSGHPFVSKPPTPVTIINIDRWLFLAVLSRFLSLLKFNAN